MNNHKQKVVDQGVFRKLPQEYTKPPTLRAGTRVKYSGQEPSADGNAPKGTLMYMQVLVHINRVTYRKQLDPLDIRNEATPRLPKTSTLS